MVSGKTSAVSFMLPDWVITGVKFAALVGPVMVTMLLEAIALKPLNEIFAAILLATVAILVLAAVVADNNSTPLTLTLLTDVLVVVGSPSSIVIVVVSVVASRRLLNTSFPGNAPLALLHSL